MYVCMYTYVRVWLVGQCAILILSIHFLRLLTEQLDLRRAVTLIEPLRDLASQDPGATGSMVPRYVAILRDADELTARLKQQPKRLDRLLGMLGDLFIDFHTFKGANFKPRIQDLLEAVDQGRSEDELIAEFSS